MIEPTFNQSTNPLYDTHNHCPVCGINLRNGDHDSMRMACPMCAPEPKHDPDVELP